MSNYSESLCLAFKQWHYNAMQGYSKRYGFSVYLYYSEFRTLSFNESLKKIEKESPKLFSRLERISNNIDQDVAKNK
ncbi:MAG: hypothetical protein U0354_18720 [Candidatus Sericytochromatia bacterium]